MGCYEQELPTTSSTLRWRHKDEFKMQQPEDKEVSLEESGHGL